MGFLLMCRISQLANPAYPFDIVSMIRERFEEVVKRGWRLYGDGVKDR
jgi:hypothetical protein